MNRDGIHRTPPYSAQGVNCPLDLVRIPSRHAASLPYSRRALEAE